MGSAKRCNVGLLVFGGSISITQKSEIIDAFSCVSTRHLAILRVRLKERKARQRLVDFHWLSYPVPSSKQEFKYPLAPMTGSVMMVFQAKPKESSKATLQSFAQFLLQRPRSSWARPTSIEKGQRAPMYILVLTSAYQV